MSDLLAREASGESSRQSSRYHDKFITTAKNRCTILDYNGRRVTVVLVHSLYLSGLQFLKRIAGGGDRRNTSMSRVFQLP